MAKAYRCDRCGKYLDVYSIALKDNKGEDVKGIPILYRKIETHIEFINKGNGIQLCKGCAISFNKWLDMED